jgi:hypothetical protein
MIFTPDEKMQLFNRLPALELSYEPKLHKKVHTPLYYIIPKGPKALVWYTYWGDENVCLLVMLNERGNYSDIKLYTTVFSDVLALGTVIYGTHFIHQGKPYFTCEQLYYYKGLHVAKTKSYTERLSLLLDMFQTSHVEQVAYTTDSLIVGLPVMTETWEEAAEEMAHLPYQVYGIGAPRGVGTGQNASIARGVGTGQNVARDVVRDVGRNVNAFIPAPLRKTVFKVKAELSADTYSLYSMKDNTLIGTAMVPTYKCSVMLNTLFRNIKENTNLDLLEESDDESEFENTQLDKFVDLEKTMVMECVFLKKFQKWQIIGVCAL